MLVDRVDEAVTMGSRRRGTWPRPPSHRVHHPRSHRVTGWARWLGLVLACPGGPLGCGQATVFECEQAEQCSRGGEMGTCEADGYCSFPDPSCPSERRYGELSPPGLAGSCVPVQTDATDSTNSSTGMPSPPVSTTTGDGRAESSSSSGPPLPLDDSGTTTAWDLGGGPTSTTMPGSSDTGVPLTVLSYGATLTGCNDPIGLNPDECEGIADPSPGAMLVDEAANGMGPFNSYLRFDLDDQLDIGAVVSVTLRITTTPSDSADSNASGEVWQVEPFTLDDLFMFQPATVGPLLAADQGAVFPDTVVQWPLPPDVLVPNRSTLYLGVVANSTNGIDYWAMNGLLPPELVVEQLP